MTIEEVIAGWEQHSDIAAYRQALALQGEREIRQAFEAGWHARCQVTGKYGPPGDWEQSYALYRAAPPTQA